MIYEREQELIKLVKEDWEYFDSLDKEEQTDNITDTVLSKYPWTFKLIKSKKRKTYTRCMAAVEYDGNLLEYVPKKMQDKELVSIAVYKNPNAYVWIKNNKLKTFELSVDVVKRRRTFINAVPKELREKVRNTVISQDRKREKELESLITDYNQ